MASSSNGNGNLVDELEEAFQSCIHALTKEESSTGIDKDEIKLEVDQTTLKFIDLARQMEAFFLQKRFLLSSLKPDLLLKEENFDLKQEIARKDDLIRKHYDKIETWKSLLSDQNQQNYNKLPAPGGMQLNDIRNIGGPIPPGAILPPQPGQMMNVNQMSSPIHHMTNQQQQQQMMQAQHIQMSPQLPGGNPQQQQQQQMFISQNSGPSGNMVGVGPRSGPGNPLGFNNQGGNVLQGPLAYLEKTTSNIDLVGMGDGRR